MIRLSFHGWKHPVFFWYKLKKPGTVCSGWVVAILTYQSLSQAGKNSAGIKWRTLPFNVSRENLPPTKVALLLRSQEWTAWTFASSEV